MNMENVCLSTRNLFLCILLLPFVSGRRTRLLSELDWAVMNDGQQRGGIEGRETCDSDKSRLTHAHGNGEKEI